jgi:hypothetical protein
LPKKGNYTTIKWTAQICTKEHKSQQKIEQMVYWITYYKIQKIRFYIILSNTCTQPGLNCFFFFFSRFSLHLSLFALNWISSHSCTEQQQLEAGHGGGGHSVLLTAMCLGMSVVNVMVGSIGHSCGWFLLFLTKCTSYNCCIAP